MIFRIIEDVELARRTVLHRGPTREVELPAIMAERLRAAFGADLTPEEAVDRILSDVRQRGDAALSNYTFWLDGISVTQGEVGREVIEEAYRCLPERLVAALSTAAERIRAFHTRQLRTSWLDFDGEGALGQLVRPLERVGIYVPGFTAAYPSTLLMQAIPAKVAGVKEVIVASPPRNVIARGEALEQSEGNVSAVTLVAADIAQVDRVFAVGGAQAIAALAYGTESIPRVDKILGPGGLFVTLAKRKVFGDVAIDQLAGPTETMIVADEEADAALIAVDLLAQAEHDVLASALLITPSKALAQVVWGEMSQRLPTLARKEIIEQSLHQRGAAIITRDLSEALELANQYAPEHLCLMVAEPWRWLGQVRNAGGVFLGEASAEALGDYVAGPSHVMPTGGTARFFSPISLYDFVKVTSVIALGPQRVRELGPSAIIIAEAEGLTAHAEAIRLRLSRG